MNEINGQNERKNEQKMNEISNRNERNEPWNEKMNEGLPKMIEMNERWIK